MSAEQERAVLIVIDIAQSWLAAWAQLAWMHHIGLHPPFWALVASQCFGQAVLGCLWRRYKRRAAARAERRRK